MPCGEPIRKALRAARCGASGKRDNDADGHPKAPVRAGRFAPGQRRAFCP